MKRKKTCLIVAVDTTPTQDEKLRFALVDLCSALCKPSKEELTVLHTSEAKWSEGVNAACAFLSKESLHIHHLSAELNPGDLMDHIYRGVETEHYSGSLAVIGTFKGTHSELTGKIFEAVTQKEGAKKESVET